LRKIELKKILIVPEIEEIPDKTEDNEEPEYIDDL
jgi:hypothetical protein